VGRAEVRTVAAEDGDPLTPLIVDRFRHHVGDVVLATTGHADVRRGGAGVLTTSTWQVLAVSPWAPKAVVA
jgi:hypothetical protein